jgi:hypothetical protein
MSYEDTDNRDKLMAIDNWYATQPHHAEAMDAIRWARNEPDNTLVIWSSSVAPHAMQPQSS